MLNGTIERSKCTRLPYEKSNARNETVHTFWDFISKALKNKHHHLIQSL